MAAGDDVVRSLREALKVSPDNLPLRKHLAETLLSIGRPEEAEKEFRQALAQSPEDAGLKLGLAHAFYQLAKNSAALVIVEELIRGRDTPAKAYVLHARLLVRAGDLEGAAREYRKGIDLDPAAGDPHLAGQLGVRVEAPATAEEVDGRLRAPVEAGGEGPSLEIEKPELTFRDVGGMDALKEEIRIKIIHPMTRPELYKAYGKPIGGGILMYGPPGCGKTYLARATAGEIKARFLAVGISDVLDMWIGQSEKNLHEFFEQARQNAPCVLFFDEVDALGASRADMRHSAGRQLINQFLSELDGVKSANDGVLILAATNAPWHLDSAFRRPGRFDRILFVPPPDAEARGAILRILSRGKPVSDIDYEGLAKKLKDFSGADLKAVVDLAVEAKLREALKDGTPRPLGSKDLSEASSKVKPSTREWFSTARNYALYANQGGLYDEILKYLKL
jgi:AAA+ superfamily predicted ATPase